MHNFANFLHKIFIRFLNQKIQSVQNLIRKNKMIYRVNGFVEISDRFKVLRSNTELSWILITKG